MLLDHFLKSPLAPNFGINRGPLLHRFAGIIPCDGPQPRLVHGRVIAVGDSGGQALPLLGEGIRYAIEAGRMAGAALASALENEGNLSKSLSNYERRWQRKYQIPFELAQRANVLLSQYGDRQWDAGVQLLEGMRPNDVAKLLRMEPSFGQLTHLFLKRDFRAARLILRLFGH
jgi:digeranylgeranylglycerophospholipid reductase